MADTVTKLVLGEWLRSYIRGIIFESQQLLIAELLIRKPITDKIYCALNDYRLQKSTNTRAIRIRINKNNQLVTLANTRRP